MLNRTLAAASVLFMLQNKARQCADESKEDGGGGASAAIVQQLYSRLAPPPALSAHAEFLHQLAGTEIDVAESVRSDYHLPVLCNYYSTCQEVFLPTTMAIYGAIGASSQNSDRIEIPGGGTAGAKTSGAQAPTEPLTMDFLDSLTVHTKMSLVHSIVQFVVKQVRATKFGFVRGLL